jgi:hypothetical protein
MFDDIIMDEALGQYQIIFDQSTPYGVCLYEQGFSFAAIMILFMIGYTTFQAFIICL